MQTLHFFLVLLNSVLFILFIFFVFVLHSDKNDHHFMRAFFFELLHTKNMTLIMMQTNPSTPEHVWGAKKLRDVWNFE